MSPCISTGPGPHPGLSRVENSPDRSPSGLIVTTATDSTRVPATGVTVRDDMRQEVFRPLPIHLGALDETLKWGGEAVEATDARIDVELTVQDGTLHLWLGLDRVDVRAACDDFARLLHTLPYTDCQVGDDHVLLRLHGDLETDPLFPWPP